MLGLLLLAVAAGLLVAGAELFLDNIAAGARRLGVTTLAAGLLLAGAEPEELLTVVIAALRDRPALAVGDAFGANVTMLTLTLGLAALLRPLPVSRRVREYAAMSVVAGGLGLLALVGSRVTRLDGLLLAVAYAALVAVVWRREKEPPAIGELAELAEDEDATARRPGTALALALGGIVVMTVGGLAAVEGATRVVSSLDLTDTSVGLTLLALATTAELFALVLAAARHDLTDVAVAGVVGSAAYNATLSLGAGGLARPLDAGGFVAPALLAALLPLLVVGLARRGSLGRAGGALLVAVYLGYAVVALTP